MMEYFWFSINSKYNMFEASLHKIFCYCFCMNIWLHADRDIHIAPSLFILRAKFAISNIFFSESIYINEAILSQYIVIYLI